MCFLAVLSCGCGQPAGSQSRTSLPPGDVPPAPASDRPLVDHPEYANWRRFPVGTTVVRNKEVANEQGIVRVTTTLRLVEKTVANVTIETQVTVDRVGHPLIENPPQRTEFPATFSLPAGMQPEQFSLPSLKARRVGETRCSAAGTDYPAELFTWEERNETGPMAVKLWRSDDVPGRMIRQEIRGPMHESVEELSELIVPASEQPPGT
jgi:hypothetical protein